MTKSIGNSAGKPGAITNIKRTCEGYGHRDRSARPTKAEAVLKLLRSKRGASIEEMREKTGWQAHSVRGFLSGTVKKRMGMSLDSDPDKQGVRRYRVVEDKPASVTIG